MTDLATLKTERDAAREELLKWAAHGMVADGGVNSLIAAKAACAVAGTLLLAERRLALAEAAEKLDKFAWDMGSPGYRDAGVSCAATFLRELLPENAE